MLAVKDLSLGDVLMHRSLGKPTMIYVVEHKSKFAIHAKTYRYFEDGQNQNQLGADAMAMICFDDENQRCSALGYEYLGNIVTLVEATTTSAVTGLGKYFSGLGRKTVTSCANDTHAGWRFPANHMRRNA